MNALPVGADDIFTFGQGMLTSTVSGNLGADNGAGVDADPDGSLLGWLAGNWLSLAGDGDRFLGVWFQNGVLGYLTIEGTLSYPHPVWNTATAIATEQGGMVWLSTNGSFTYQSAAGFTGVDRFVYTLVDGAYGLDTATVTLNVTPTAGANDRPLAVDDAFHTTEDSVLAGNVIADNGNGPDSDPDGDALSVVARTFHSDAGGLVRLYADGSFTYAPRVDYVGTDAFRYTLRDAAGATDTGTVTLVVGAVNDAPIARDDAFSGAHDRVITGNVLANDSDPEGAPLGVVAGVRATAAGGEVTLNADGSFSYRSAAGHVGTDGFAYVAVDALGATDAGWVTLTLTNAAPVARPDAFAVVFGKGKAGNLLADNGQGPDSDSDGDALAVVGGTLTSARGGTLVLQADGRFVYTPPALFFGTDSFSYTVRDGLGGQASATVQFVTPAPAGAWHGTQGSDTWTGSDAGGWAFAGGGADVINAMGGSDRVACGDGRDTVSGGLGADLLYGEGDKDVLNGDSGKDRLYGGAGADDLYGGNGADTLYGGSGADQLHGGASADHFVFDAPGAEADKVMDLSATDRLVFAAADLGLAAGALPDASYLVLSGSGDGAHGRFVYNGAAKALYWDDDGLAATAGQLICTFDTRVTLTAEQFLLV